MTLALVFASALFLSVMLLPVLMRNAERWHLLDAPTDARKVHTVTKPRIGGIAIALGAFASVAYWTSAGTLPPGLMLGAVVILVFGYLDDRHNLPVRWKFLGQSLAVLLLVGGGVVMDRVPLMGLDTAPDLVRYPLTFFFVLGAINAVNLSDGLDGLAAGMTLMSLFVIAAIGVASGHTAEAHAAAAVAGGVLGFLRFNTFPSRIFMGDTGSQFLGYSLAALAVMVTQYPDAAVSPALPLFIVGMPILDTVAVMTLRILRGGSPFVPDNRHIHHQVMAVGLKHHQAVALLYGLQFVLLALAWSGRFESDLVLLSGFAAFSGVVLGSIAILRHRKFRFGSSANGHPAERRNMLLRRFSWVYRHSAAVLSVALGAVLLAAALQLDAPVAGVGRSGIAIAAGCAAMWALFRDQPAFVTRVNAYIAGAVLVYAMVGTAHREVLNLALDAALALMAAFLFLAIRMTRREVFRPDTQDGLVLLMIAIIPLLPLGQLAEMDLGRIALRSAALMYCCEYVLTRAPERRYLLLNACSVVALAVMGGALA